MKRLILTTCIIVGLFILATSDVRADTLRIDQGPYSFGDGGEFVISGLTWALPFYASDAKYIDNHGHGGFATFCLERQEYFYPDNIYNYAVNDRAVQGGAGVTGDPISVGTAWLYLQFGKGTLDNYDYDNSGGHRDDNAGALQDTIWWLEGELLSNPGNIFSAMVLSHFGSEANAKDDNLGQFPVAVLNLFNSDRAQDQLVLVPEPTTLMLLGAGLIGLVLFIRRKR